MYCQCGCGQITAIAKRGFWSSDGVHQPKGMHCRYMRGHNKRGDPTEKFMAQVDKLPNDGCWLWTGKPTPDGYGRFYFRERLAHRASWTLLVGPIPEGLQVCHACDVKLCVRPDHLWVGTQKENVQDCIDKGRFKGHLNLPERG